MDVVSGTDGDKAEASAQFLTVHPNPLVGLNTADLKLAIQLKELDLRVKQQEHDTQLLCVRQCELEARRVSPRPVSGLQTLMTSVPSGSPVVSHVPHTPGTGEVDISRQIRLVPICRETEIDSYFSAFERIAAALHWPREIWSLLLQCRLTGKAQKFSAALSIEDSLDYDILKASVLRAVRPGSIDPMTAVVQRVKGFAYYSLSFSRHNKNIKIEGFFLYILSRYFI